MAKTKPSLANLLRDHINEQLGKNFDYSLATNRKQDILNFIESHKLVLDKHQLKIDTIRPSHNTALEKCLKNKGIDPASIGRSKRTPKFSGDLNATITPAPQAGAVDTTVKTGAQVQGVDQAGQVIVQPQVMIFDEKSVSATLSAIFLMFRFAYPDLELLTDEEKDSLGKVWLPAFNKYLTDNWAIIGVPLFATAGIFLPKIIKARKAKKIREGAGETKAKQEEIDSKLKNRADQIKKEQEEKTKAYVKANENLPPNTPPIGQIATDITLPKEKTDEQK